jgi:ABC-type multidrug transport system fused ATPase/permease subunit
MAERGTRSDLAFLLSYYRPYAFRMIMAVVFMLPGNALSLFFPRLTGSLVDSVVSSPNSDEITRIGLFFVGLLVLQAIIGYIVGVTLARTTEKVIAGLRTDLFSHIVHLPMSKLSGTRVGELSSRLSSDLAQIQETFSFSILQLLRQSVFLIGSIIIIVSTSLQLTIPVLVGTPIIVGAAVLLGRRIRAMSTKTQDALAAASTISEEALQSMTAVKSFVQEQHEAARYSAAINDVVRLAVKGARLRSLFVTFIVFVIFGGIAAVILYGAGLVAEGSITIGELLSFLMYAMFVGGAMGSFAEIYGQIQKSLGAAVRIKEILHSTPENLGNDDGTMRVRSVQFNDVSFTYPERSDLAVLSNVSFRIAPGERVAFVGESGAGKSTTAALIQRLYEPVSGVITYDDQPANTLSLAQVRRNIGNVPQDIVLFGGTIEDNIRYGAREASEDDVRRAAELAHATEFIDRFPDRMQTVVGERGIKLSGGQRQRVAIARALLKNPPILVLDEATSSLDAESESLIQEALERLMHGRTTIIIAHRLSTVRRCDRIYVFDRGQIVEIGTHAELLQIEGGRYRRWCSLQTLS